MNAFTQKYVAGDPFVAGTALSGAPAHAVVPVRWIAPDSTRRFRGERPCQS
jgi:hypothetical protein